MVWREGCEADLAVCLKLEPRHLGDELVGRAGAPLLWKAMMGRQAFTSVVFHKSETKGPEGIIGFGASVFVTAGFATREMERPRPGLNGRILAGLARGGGAGFGAGGANGTRGTVAGMRPAVLADAQLFATGGRRALDLVILSSSYRVDALTPEQVVELEMMLAFAFLEQHVGFCLNRILFEATSERQRVFHESSGVWRTVACHPGGERALMVLTREEAFGVSGSIAAPLFRYQEPTLQLRETEKHLLAQALQGNTDGELARRMHLSLSTIKKRWSTLYERVAEVRPDLLPEADGRVSETARGAQKRHRILAYARMHPEELRPFRWCSQG